MMKDDVSVVLQSLVGLTDFTSL
ncbi:uncharacterized protein METZ01_LOCUS128836 [marine metagenome]|uniref:Uncharacterized protein n=1 Tax=marine metagenome TaxID=408172 RepID=A0A381YH88_9ZZZZ